MDLETTIQQILRGEFYLEMESDEQYEMLIDACQEMGVSTTWLEPNDFSYGYQFVAVDEGDLASWSKIHVFLIDYPDAHGVKFSDLISEFIDVDAASLL